MTRRKHSRAKFENHPPIREDEIMMRKISLFYMPFLCGFFLLLPLQAIASAETSEAGNTYLAGGDLKIWQPVAGDLIAAGGRISIEGQVGADAAIAGGAVDIRSPIKQDARVAAGTVNIQNSVGADLVAAGGTVRIEPSSNISGSAWLAGGEVNVFGRIGRGAGIYGNKVTLAGEIVGDTRLIGEQIILTPTARIDGNLSYASPMEFPENQRTQISGTITRLQNPGEWEESRMGGIGLSWFHPIFLIGMLIYGMLLYALFPRAVLGAEKAIEQHPVRSLLIGLALLFAVPPLAILFMATIVGLPIGFVLLLLYPLTLLFGYLATAFFLGQRMSVAMKLVEPFSLKKRALILTLALLILSLAFAVPFLGGFVLIFCVVMGLGGWGVWMHRQWKAARHASG